MKKIIMYRDKLLPYSETFIPTQVESLSSYTGFYVGTSRTPESKFLIPQERSITLSDLVSRPGIWKTAFKIGGIVHPKWFKFMQDLSPCIMHAHFGLDGIWGLLLAEKLGIPLLVTFRGNDITGMQASEIKQGRVQMLDFFFKRGQFYRDFYVSKRQQLFKEARYCIAVSDFIRSQLIEKGCPPEKAVVLYTGVNVDKFTPDPNVVREPIVLFVGRLVEKKGCEYLIRAMSQVQAIMPEVELVMIGDGSLRSTLEELAKSSLKRYSFLGSRSHDVVKEWMNRAFLLCAPSITATTGDSEGLPNVVNEAAAMGLPVVASIHAGIPEAVVHGETGFLVPEKDWEAMAKHILTLLGDSSLRNRFAMAGRNRVEQEFNLKRNTEKLEKIYNGILAEFC
ncbi:MULTISPECIES: glycosyltransferase [Cyanophyceae]|uniref:glycosyltransferase n=1 Tax=Cyanophyceae TaxID=3028117 RepID=UPI0016833008|nr:glycosyltransferase [Trichocoleus sp. FACHB-40]MBD2005762.1 glycosyltransferase [Trichocoleus sp. FACHB-40]